MFSGWPFFCGYPANRPLECEVAVLTTGKRIRETAGITQM